jgi:cell division protein FtsB
MVRAVARVVRRMTWPLLFAGILVGVLALGAYPARTYFDKKQEIAASETRLAQMTADNADAQAHVDALKTDAEIERIAREHGLVKKGEEAYHVLPPPQDPVEIPDVWPFNRLHKQLGS